MTKFVQASAKATVAGGPLIRGLAQDAYPVEARHLNWLVRENQAAWPLVAARQFILATRDTGYRSTSAAVSELIDNALQAGADVVRVLLREDRIDAQAPHGSSRRVSLAVLDNGSGMNSAALRTALQFGGSERFNDRSGAGRFGMGLPNSSVSQSLRVDLYSWRDGQTPFYSYLDVGEIARGTMRDIPVPVTRQLPEWVRVALDTSGQAVPNSGTLVLWPECDRLPYRKVSTVSAKLNTALGRTYRYALRGNIRLFVDGHAVAPIDPMMEWGSVAEKYGAATQYGDELAYEFKVPAAPRRTSIVRVRFTVLPVRRWARLPLEVRRELGVIGRGGVSIVRAGREIDDGWYLLGTKRRENYDDWWRCEVRFEPELDEYFGVTHSKQGITPHPVLYDTLVPDLAEIARTLNGVIRAEFLRLSTKHARPTDADNHEFSSLPRIAENAAATVASERERFLPPGAQHIRRFRVMGTPLTTARFFVTALKRGELVVTLNSQHPVYAEISRADARSREFINTVLLAAARAEVMTRSGGSDPSSCVRRSAEGTADTIEEFLEAWSDTLAAYLSSRR